MAIRLMLNDDYYALFKEWSFETYPAEGDRDALTFCRQFAEQWNGHTALGLVCPQCRAPGKTGLMVCVYKALLPRIRAELRDAVYVNGVDISLHSEMPDIYRPMAAVMYPAGLLMIDDLAIFPIQSGGQITRFAPPAVSAVGRALPFSLATHLGGAARTPDARDSGGAAERGGGTRGLRPQVSTC